MNLCCAAAALLGLGFQAGSGAIRKIDPKSSPPLFKDIQPILNASCVGCHSGDRPKAGIDLSSYESVMRGGEDGPVVKIGAPKHSLLVRALRGVNGVRQMPPRRNPLSEDRVILIE